MRRWRKRRARPPTHPPGAGGNPVPNRRRTPTSLRAESRQRRRVPPGGTTQPSRAAPLRARRPGGFQVPRRSRAPPALSGSRLPAQPQAEPRREEQHLTLRPPAPPRLPACGSQSCRPGEDPAASKGAGGWARGAVGRRRGRGGFQGRPGGCQGRQRAETSVCVRRPRGPPLPAGRPRPTRPSVVPARSAPRQLLGCASFPSAPRLWVPSELPTSARGRRWGPGQLPPQRWPARPLPPPGAPGFTFRASPEPSAPACGRPGARRGTGTPPCSRWLLPSWKLGSHRVQNS